MRTTKNIENQEILTVFKQLADSNKEVRLLNVYKGVPISYEAKVIEVAEASALFRTEKSQLVCLDYERMTHIQSLFLPKIVHARVQDVDMDRGESVLGEFEYVSGRIGARTQVRVIPEKEVKISIQLEDSDTACEGELADISLDGLGFYIPGEIHHPECIKKGTLVSIFLSLPSGKVKKQGGESSEEQVYPAMRHHTIQLEEDALPGLAQGYGFTQGENRQVNLSGEIVNFHEEAQQQRWRIGVKINPHDLHKGEISRYITRRQAEIMREIRDAYEKTRPKKR